MASIAFRRANYTAGAFKLAKRGLAAKVDSCNKLAEPTYCAPCSRKGKKVKLLQSGKAEISDPDINRKRSVDCCEDSCPVVLPRFDSLYYRPSDILKRTYHQTWDECPQLFIKPKTKCNIAPIKAPFQKRIPIERPLTACKQPCHKDQSKCPSITLPRCRGGRKPPVCLKETLPSKCTKRKTPLPAFSECYRANSKNKIIECNCLGIPSICQVWALHHRQLIIKK